MLVDFVSRFYESHHELKIFDIIQMSIDVDALNIYKTVKCGSRFFQTY